MNNVRFDTVTVQQLTACSRCNKVAYQKGSQMLRRTEEFKTYELSNYYCKKCAEAVLKDQSN